MKIALVFAGLAVLTMLTGCVTYRSGRQLRGSAFDKTNNLGVIELDDQGRYWSRPEFEEVIGHVRSQVLEGGATIVVFIHGWHHSARSDDENLEGFRDALHKLRTEMDLPVYRAARRKLFGREDASVIGVYVGWRGRSLPGFFDYLTFWGRKAAAERVGEGDVVEVLSELSKIWSAANDAGKYTGLVTIGHSFGGQVALSAVSSVLRNRITAAHQPGAAEFQPLTGFGDLVVLVNPAAESALFAAISEQTREAQFAPQQSPAMLVVSSENDRATGSWFPFGRRFAVVGQLHRGQEYPLNIRALGWYKPHITHCLCADGGTLCSGIQERPLSYRGPHLTISNTPRPQEAYAGVWVESDLLHPEDIELAGDIGMVATKFFRVSDNIDPNLPFVVAKATKEIINGHNGMFDWRFTDFLLRYVAGTEIKRFTILARARATAGR